MKALLVAVALTLVGCLAEVGETDALAEPTPAEDDDIVFGHSGVGNSGGPCGNAYDVIYIQSPDGSWTAVKLPVPCDPFYIDKGDPPPLGSDDPWSNPYEFDGYGEYIGPN